MGFQVAGKDRRTDRCAGRRHGTDSDTMEIGAEQPGEGYAVSKEMREDLELPSDCEQNQDLCQQGDG